MIAMRCPQEGNRDFAAVSQRASRTRTRRPPGCDARHRRTRSTSRVPVSPAVRNPRIPLAYPRVLGMGGAPSPKTTGPRFLTLFGGRVVLAGRAPADAHALRMSVTAGSAAAAVVGRPPRSCFRAHCRSEAGRSDPHADRDECLAPRARARRHGRTTPQLRPTPSYTTLRDEPKRAPDEKNPADPASPAPPAL